MQTYTDLVAHCYSITRGRRLSSKVLLQVLAKSVNLTIGQLLVWSLEQPDFNYSLHDRSLLVQASDMGMAAAIKERAPQIGYELQKAAQIWPITYLSATFHCSTWWIEAGLVAYSISRPSVLPKVLPMTPGEIDFRKASRPEKMVMVAKATSGMNTPTLERIGIALGIPAHRVGQYAEDIDLYRSDLIPTATKDRVRQASQRRTQRTNLDEFHRVGILRDFNNCGSVRAYAKSAGISYQTAHKRAVRVGFLGINTKTLMKAPRLARIQQHLAENPNAILTTEQWGEVTDPDSSIYSKRQLWYIREALKSAGLVHKSAGRNAWAWMRPDQKVVARVVYDFEPA